MEMDFIRPVLVELGLHFLLPRSNGACQRQRGVEDQSPTRAQVLPLASNPGQILDFKASSSPQARGLRRLRDVWPVGRNNGPPARWLRLQQGVLV
jgi:hypothetical protein